MPRAKLTSPQILRVMEEMSWSDGPHYGLAIAKRLGLAQGTVYGILKQLVEQGYVATIWDVPDLPKPATFVITPPQDLDDPYYDLPDAGKGPPRLLHHLTSEGFTHLRKLKQKLRQSQ